MGHDGHAFLCLRWNHSEPITRVCRKSIIVWFRETEFLLACISSVVTRHCSAVVSDPLAILRDIHVGG
jgi:hypothetical protein